jgi:hypothetical protein
VTGKYRIQGGENYKKIGERRGAVLLYCPLPLFTIESII